MKGSTAGKILFIATLSFAFLLTIIVIVLPLYTEELGDSNPFTYANTAGLFHVLALVVLSAFSLFLVYVNRTAQKKVKNA